MTDRLPAKTSGIHFPPPFLYVGHLLLGWLLDRWIPLPALPRTPSRVMAAVLLLPGFALIFWSLWLFLRARTSPLPMRPTTAIVRSGPYRFTRNPMYLGMLLLYVGVALLYRLGFHADARARGAGRSLGDRQEERYLETTFGDDYQRYKAQVRRWI